MSRPHPRRGAPLPYKTLAGVVPCPGGWLAGTAKLQGITISPEEPQVFGSFLEVLDYKPAYEVIALFCPVGLLDESISKGRRCDRDARRLLGRPRSGAISSAPGRATLSFKTLKDAGRERSAGISAVGWRRMKHVAEVDKDIAPYWQRTVIEVHAELSFYQLNGDRSLSFSKHTQQGRDERRGLLESRIPGVDRILDARIRRVRAAQLLDAAACLWTARRIISRAVDRLPEDPEWDTKGLRMEIVR